MRSIAATLFFGTFLLAGTGGASAASVERGDYLVNTIMACGSCHTPFGPAGFDPSKALSGRLVEDVPQFKAIAPNLTPAGHIADWSDADLGRAIREGIRPDGTLIGPPMPFTMYRGLSDDDVASIHVRPPIPAYPPPYIQPRVELFSPRENNECGGMTLVGPAHTVISSRKARSMASNSINSRRAIRPRSILI